MQSVTLKDFDSVVKQSTVPVLVDFWAAWCGPCRQVKPTLEALDSESNGEYKVVGVDVDVSPDLATQYKVDGIPTMIVFKNGVEVSRIVGLQSKEKILSYING